MYLFCYGTRPEMIKMFPLIEKFNEVGIPYKTLFSGQHKDLYEQFKSYLPKPTYILNTMENNQSLNKLSGKIFNQLDKIDLTDIKYIIVQGDTTTAYILAMAGFNEKIKVIHLEAGLRTYDKYSPFPEEINRTLISRIADIHLCPTEIAVNNLKNEGITDNVYLVGNTVVDAFKIINNINNQNIIYNHDYLVTLHRRENRDNIFLLWDQLNEISKTKKIVYLVHPSLEKKAHEYLSNSIIKINGVDYTTMIKLITSSKGIITDSGGIQEEAVCAGKRVLVCRNTTERPETINSGWGKLIGVDILNNLDFLTKEKENASNFKNPYGDNVCNKIINILTSKNI